MASYYYGVKTGRRPGIYRTWADCEREVKGYSGAQYKKFSSYEDAVDFLGGQVASSSSQTGINEAGKDFREELDLEDGEAIAYVDGSYDLENHSYSYGVVFISKKGKETYSAREDDREMADMRNVAGEIRGAEIAMELALQYGIKKLYLHYDYTGIENWALGNWKTNREGTRSYKEYYDSIKDRLQVDFIKVKAHSGIKYNEEADRLAGEAILK